MTGVVTEPSTQPVELDQHLLQAARLWLSRSRPYYASVLFRCPIVETEAVPTFAVDEHWRIYVNPTYANGLTVVRFATALTHEINHLLRQHDGRGLAAGASDAACRRRWNIAADAEINDDLRHSDFDPAPDWIYPDTIGQPVGRTAEEYYAAFAGQGDLHDAAAGHGVPECGPGAGGEALRGAAAEALADPRLAPPVNGVEAQILRRRVAGDVTQYRHRGDVPSGLVAWAAEILSPKVDWRQQLASLLRSAVTIAGTADYDIRRFSRRSSISDEIRWPGMVDVEPATIAVVVDTSGSMSDTAIQRCLSEVQGILTSVSVAEDSIRVVTVDAAVAEDRTITDVRSIGRIGRGGTDMRVGIERVLTTGRRPDVVVVLTDGFTPWPDEPTPGVSFVVGIVGRHNPSFAPVTNVPSWMKVVVIDH